MKRSPKRRIQHHHHTESNRKKDCADIRVVSLGHFGDQFLDDDIEHGTGGEAEQIGEDGDEVACGENGEHGADRFDDAGEDTAGKSPAFFHALCAQGHRDDCAFREVLNGNAKRERKCAGRSDLRAPGEKSGVDDTDRHAFRNVVQRYGKHHHRSALQLAFRSLGGITAEMKVRDDVIEQQKKENSDPEADHGWKKGKLSHPGDLLHCREQKAPDGGGDHDAGRKAGERPRDGFVHIFFQEKHAGSAECCPEKGNEDSVKCLHDKLLPWIMFKIVR